MLIEINQGSAIPIYEQILNGLKFAIASGAIKPEELIPSVRELAKSLAVNPNTVARAHRTLQAEELVYSCRGLGLAVTKDAPERCRKERVGFFRKRFAQLLSEAEKSHLSKNEIKEMFYDLLQEEKND